MALAQMRLADKHTFIYFVSVDVCAIFVLELNFCVITTILVNANFICYKNNICVYKTVHVLILKSRHQARINKRKGVQFLEFLFM
jgi:hypothetical protein